MGVVYEVKFDSKLWKFDIKVWKFDNNGHRGAEVSAENVYPKPSLHLGAGKGIEVKAVSGQVMSDSDTRNHALYSKSRYDLNVCNISLVYLFKHSLVLKFYELNQV
jgi:hypothetical protein